MATSRLISKYLQDNPNAQFGALNTTGRPTAPAAAPAVSLATQTRSTPAAQSPTTRAAASQIPVAAQPTAAAAPTAARTAAQSAVTPLGEWEQNLYNEAKAKGMSIMDLMARPGWSESVTAQQVATVLGNAGLELPMTNAPKQTRLAEEAIAAGRTQPLGEWEQNTYNNAVASGIGSEDLAQRWKDLGVTKYQIDTIIAAAGLAPLKNRTNPYGTPGAGIPGTVNNQGSDPNYPGGLPMQQPGGGGMYGATSRRETPTQILGQVPQHPALRMVRANARRRQMVGWNGKTDTILTSGRGITTPANTVVKTLQGS